jgi:hypothetical protein
MKHIALFASVLAAFLLPAGAFANDKHKDWEKYQAHMAQIIADRIANGYTPDGRPIPRSNPYDDRCAPRYYDDRRHDHDHDRDWYRGYR